MANHSKIVLKLPPVSKLYKLFSIAFTQGNFGIFGLKAKKRSTHTAHAHRFQNAKLKRMRKPVC